MGLVRKALYLATIGWPARIVMAAILALASPFIFIIAMISIIGIPIALIFAVAPALAATYIFAEILYRFAFKRVMTPWPAILSSIGAVALAAAILATLANAALDAKTLALVGGDRDAFVKAPIRVLGLAEAGGYYDRNMSACEGACLRLLLNRSVKEVLVARLDKETSAIDLQTPAISFRLERRGPCEDKELSTQDEVVDRSDRKHEAMSPAEMARLRMAAGECLVETRTTLGAADAVVMSAVLARGRSAYNAELDAFADTVSAERISFFRRAKDGFDEQYRRTKVTALRHFPLATPGVVTGSELNTRLGFYRKARLINREKYEYGNSDSARFIVERLGLAYWLADAGTPDGGKVIDAIIRAGDAAGASRRDAIDDYIHSVTRSYNKLDREDALRIVRIFETPSIELPRSAAHGAAAIGRLQSDLGPRVADALFNRIENAAPDATTSKYNDRLVRNASRAISVLPDSALAGRKPKIMALARDTARRYDAAPLYPRLSAFGREATGDLFSIMDIALADHRDNGGRNWTDLYGASLAGLCLIGDPATPDELIARLNQAPDLKTYRQSVVIKTLLRSGMSAERVRVYFAGGANEDALKRLDQDIKFAGRNDRCD